MRFDVSMWLVSSVSLYGWCSLVWRNWRNETSLICSKITSGRFQIVNSLVAAFQFAHNVALASGQFWIGPAHVSNALGASVPTTKLGAISPREAFDAKHHDEGVQVRDGAKINTQYP